MPDQPCQPEPRASSASRVSAAPDRPSTTAIEVAVAVDDYDVVLDLLWRYQPHAVVEATDRAGVTFTVAYSSDERLAQVRRALASLEAEIRMRQDVDDWVGTWRAGAAPIAVGPFSVRLPEHESDAGAVLDLVIEPGTTFGFSHPSTTLALELLSRSRPVTEGSVRVADVGCGSGILSVAAASLGGHVVDAVDIDPTAVGAARHNAAENGLEISCAVGSATSLPQGAYAIVLANLTAATLRELRIDLERLVATGGELVLSGMLVHQAEEVAGWFAGFELVDRIIDGEWVAMRLRR